LIEGGGIEKGTDEKSFDRFCDLNRAVPSVPSFYSHFYTHSFVVSRYMFDEFALGEFWGIPIKGPPSSHSRTDESALRFPFFFSSSFYTSRSSLRRLATCEIDVSKPSLPHGDIMMMTIALH
jgi:hypothetical protein